MSDAFNDVLAEMARKERTKEAIRAADDCHLRSLLHPACRTQAQVFFTHLALSHRLEPDWKVETATTDGKTIRFNPDTLLEWTPEERHGVICFHEPMHNGQLHFARFATAEHQDLANIAGDLEINQMGKDAGFVLPREAVFPGKGDYSDMPPGKCAEEYYTLLLAKRQQGQQSGQQGGQQGGQPTPDPGGCGAFEPAQDPAQAAANAGKWQRQVACAAREAQKAQGTMPGSLEKLIDSILRPKVDPWEVLRDFLTRLAKHEQSWARINRRHMARGVYLPGKHGYELGEVVLLADISGSMTKRECSLTAGFLQGVLELFPGRLTVVYHDTKPQDQIDWTAGDGELSIEIRHGGGGTSHRWLNHWLQCQDFEPAVILACTDMETSFPDDPGIPFVWLDTQGTSDDPPFGRKLCIKDSRS
jgi:predicted metal-dependent peptidase